MFGEKMDDGFHFCQIDLFLGLQEDFLRRIEEDLGSMA
jgi:hypothetical protein